MGRLVRTRCGTVSPRTCSLAARTYAPCRNCLAMPTSPRRRCIPTLIANDCAPFISSFIRAATPTQRTKANSHRSPAAVYVSRRNVNGSGTTLCLDDGLTKTNHARRDRTDDLLARQLGQLLRASARRPEVARLLFLAFLPLLAAPLVHDPAQLLEDVRSG